MADMKNILLLFTLIAVAGCGQNQNSVVHTENPVDLNDPRVAEEISAIDAETAREADRMKALLTMSEAVKGFKMMHKRYPANLNEVVDEEILHSLPDLPAGSDFVYDASTGEVSLTDPLSEKPETEKPETKL